MSLLIVVCAAVASACGSVAADPKNDAGKDSNGSGNGNCVLDTSKLDNCKL